jgi:hypothetical protein
MSDDNIVDLKLRMQQKDLAEISEHILNKAIELMQKNKELQERLDHVEELLMKVDVIDIGEKK